MRMTFGGSDMLRIVSGTDPNAGFLDPTTLFSGDYPASRVTAFTASSGTATISFGTTYSQPPLVFGALDTGSGERDMIANCDWRWSALGGGAFGYLLQGYSYWYYYIVTTTGISQFVSGYSGTTRYWVLEP